MYVKGVMLCVIRLFRYFVYSKGEVNNFNTKDKNAKCIFI